VVGAESPVLRRSAARPILQLPGADLFTIYLNSFEAVWATSVPLASLESEAIS